MIFSVCEIGWFLKTNFLVRQNLTYFPKKYCENKEPIDFLEIFFLQRIQKSMWNNSYPIEIFEKISF